MSNFSEIVLDHLIVQSNGDVIYYDDRVCSLDLIKESLLRGFQIHSMFPFPTTIGKGFGNGATCLDHKVEDYPMSMEQFQSRGGTGISAGGGRDCGGSNRGYDEQEDLQDYRKIWDFALKAEPEGSSSEPEIELYPTALDGVYYLDNP